MHDFLQNEAKGTKVIGAESLEDMVSKLKTPRRIILLVKAGQAVDDFIDKLVSGVAGRISTLLPKVCFGPSMTFAFPPHRFLFWRLAISSSMGGIPNTETQQ